MVPLINLINLAGIFWHQPAALIFPFSIWQLIGREVLRNLQPCHHYENQGGKILFSAGQGGKLSGTCPLQAPTQSRLAQLEPLHKVTRNKKLIDFTYLYSQTKFQIFYFDFSIENSWGYLFSSIYAKKSMWRALKPSRPPSVFQIFLKPQCVGFFVPEIFRIR